MGDIGVQLHSALEILFYPVFLESRPAVIAVFSSEMVFAPALFAMVAHFPGRHSDEITVRTFDDLDIANHKLIVYRY
jgi:hypothetical protein